MGSSDEESVLLVGLSFSGMSSRFSLAARSKELNLSSLGISSNADMRA